MNSDDLSRGEVKKLTIGLIEFVERFLLTITNLPVILKTTKGICCVNAIPEKTCAAHAMPQKDRKVDLSMKKLLALIMAVMMMLTAVCAMAEVPEGRLEVRIWDYFETDAQREMIQWIMDGFALVGGILPALGIGMLLNFMGQKKILPFFFLGFFLAKFLGLGTMAITIFGAIIAFIIYLFGEKKEKEVA